jgi:hypothetical protein
MGTPLGVDNEPEKQEGVIPEEESAYPIGIDHSTRLDGRS